jgi:hypothetical protein
MKTRARGLITFLVLAFGFAWLGMAGAWALGYSLVNPLVQLPFAFAPALAAFVVRRWVTGEGFADAGLRLRLREAWPQYLMAWLGPAALVAATAAVAALFGVPLASLDRQLGGLPRWALVAGRVPAGGRGRHDGHGVHHDPDRGGLPPRCWRRGGSPPVQTWTATSLVKRWQRPSGWPSAADEPATPGSASLARPRFSAVTRARCRTPRRGVAAGHPGTLRQRSGSGRPRSSARQSGSWTRRGWRT